MTTVPATKYHVDQLSQSWWQAVHHCWLRCHDRTKNLVWFRCYVPWRQPRHYLSVEPQRHHVQQGHDESADLRANVNPARIRTFPESGPGWLPEFNGDFFVQRYIYNKIFKGDPFSLFPEIWAKLWFPMSQCWKILVKILDPGPEMYDFLNLISFSLSSETYLIKVFMKNW